MKKRESGTVLVFCLILMLGGAFVLAGCLYLVSSRVQYTEQLAYSSKRRIVLENSRLLATQFLLQSVLPSSFSGTRALMVDGGTTARFTIAIPSSITPLTNQNIYDTSVNPFSPGAEQSYHQDISATLWDGDPADSDHPGTSFTWTFKARSRSPIFGFDLYTSQKQTLSSGVTVAASGLVVAGNLFSGTYLGANAMIWPTNSTYNITSRVSYSTPSGSVFTGGASSLAISNFAFPPVTSGTAGLTSGYDGTISTINPSGGASSLQASAVSTTPCVNVVYLTGTGGNLVNSATNTTATPIYGVTSAGSGTATIQLSVSGTTNNGNLESVSITGGLKTLILKGQTSVNDTEANAATALLITYVEQAVEPSNNYLSRIELQGQNYRRVYLAVKKAGNAASNQVTLVGDAGNPQWRLAASFENTPILFSQAAGSTLQITGGLRSDASVQVANNNTVTILREVDPKYLERKADRIGWLEAFKQ